VRPATLTTEQVLPRPLHELFPFFAEARNLERITPPWLRFEVLTPGPISMRAGALIDYRLRWRGLPLRWRTEIEVWEPPHRFVDRQVRGPYLLWRHEHRFVAHGNGTLATDRIDYAAPGGRLVHRLVVDRDVRRIFEYRRRALLQLFESPANGPV
jgi:ligand-binding SRPBCC domain-containing protein